MLEEYAEGADAHIIAEGSDGAVLEGAGEGVLLILQLEAEGSRAARRKSKLRDGADAVLRTLDVRAHLSRRAQRIVVHDVIDDGVVERHIEVCDDGREVGAVVLECPTVTVELTAVHHGVGEFCMTAAHIVGKLKQGIFVRCETDDTRQAVASVA